MAIKTFQPRVTGDSSVDFAERKERNTGVRPRIRIRLVVAVTLILLGALFFRTPLISRGLPYFYDEDEAHHFNRVVNMVKRGEFNPRYFHKPSLHFYLRMPIVAASFLWSVRKGELRSVQEIRTEDPFGIANYSFSASPVRIAKWNRAFDVALGVGTVFIVFLLGTLIGGSAFVGIAASALAAVSPGLVEGSATIGVDSPLTFLCALGAYLALRTVRRFTLGSLFTAGLVCGLSISTKYNALPIALIPLVVCLVARRFSFKTISVALLAPIAGFILGSPFILSSIPLFLDQLAYEVWHYGIAGHEGHMGEPGLSQAWFFTTWLSLNGIGMLAVIAAVLGLLATLLMDKHGRGLLLVTAVFPVLYFILMSMQRANFTRNLYPLIPFLCVFAALAIQRLLALPSKSRHKAWLGAIATVILVVQPVYHLAVARELSIPDSRLGLIKLLSERRGELTDVAVAGELQLSVQSSTVNGVTVPEVPGVTVVDLDKTSPLSLYLSGFDSIVTNSAEGAKLSATSVTLDQSIDGETNTQRIVRNPAIKVFKINTPAVSELRAEAAKVNPPKLTLNFNPEDGEKSVQCGPARDEDYCWLTERFTIAQTNTPESVVRGKREVPLTLQLMTPWKGQKITLSTPGWTSDAQEVPADSNWHEVVFLIPPLQLSNGNTLEFSIEEVHSPKSEGISNDARRLGVAIKEATLFP